MDVGSVLLPAALAAIRLASATAEWLMTYAIHSTLLIGGTWFFLASPPGRRLSSAATAWLWRFALLGGMASATVQVLRSPDPLAGTLRVGSAAPSRAMVRVELGRTVALEEAAAGARPTGIRTGTLTWQGLPPGALHTTVSYQPRWIPLGLATWLAGALLLLALFLHARRRFFRSLADRRSGEFTLAGNALRAVVDQARVTRSIRLTMSDSLTSPVALGSDEICIPRRVLAELDPIRMESILAHELAHLERRDPFWLTTARVVEAVFFFQPLNRLARARLQESAEFASDGWAAGVISRPLDLAHCLARVAEWTVGSTRLLAPAMAERRGTVLVRRVQRLTDDAHREPAADIRGLRLAGLATMLALVTLAPRALVGGPVALATREGNVFVMRLDSVRADVHAGPRGTRDVRIVRFSPRP